MSSFLLVISVITSFFTRRSMKGLRIACWSNASGLKLVITNSSGISKQALKFQNQVVILYYHIFSIQEAADDRTLLTEKNEQEKP